VKNILKGASKLKKIQVILKNLKFGKNKEHHTPKISKLKSSSFLSSK
jgi:hypothetical protein